MSITKTLTLPRSEQMCLVPSELLTIGSVIRDHLPNRGLDLTNIGAKRVDLLIALFARLEYPILAEGRYGTKRSFLLPFARPTDTTRDQVQDHESFHSLFLRTAASVLSIASVMGVPQMTDLEAVKVPANHYTEILKSSDGDRRLVVGDFTDTTLNYGYEPAGLEGLPSNFDGVRAYEVLAHNEQPTGDLEIMSRSMNGVMRTQGDTIIFTPFKPQARDC